MLPPMKLPHLTGALVAIAAAGALYLWRKHSMSLARLNTSIDLLTAAVDRVADRLNNTDTVPAADVDNAASRVEDQVTRINAALESSGGNVPTPEAARHK